MTSSHRQALGRGLSSLIPKTGEGSSAAETVDIDLVVPNPEQPRAHFDAESLRELAESIREHGILQPLVVTQVRSEMGVSTYQLIAGERRLQAARLAGVTRVPVVVREAAGAALLEMALVENLQRQDLNPLEEAAAFKRLADDFGMTQERIAQRVGRSRTRVANTIRLLTLEEDIRASLTSGQISEGHARALLAIEGSPTRLDAWRRIVADALTVRQTEEIARLLKETAPARRDGARAAAQVQKPDPQVREIEASLRGALGARVSLTRGRTGGRIVIRFHSDDELEGIVERLTRG
ncbi:MAG: ParB/RepB/Spo0J family partition protein [Chloroflexota bacterium]|nr:ParB/RepB/Spo0J family partition protein [Chloroflexota bacterium]